MLQNIQPLDFVSLSVLGITCETQHLGVKSLPVLRRRVKETDDKVQRVKCFQMLGVSFRPIRKFII